MENNYIWELLNERSQPFTVLRIKPLLWQPMIVNWGFVFIHN